MVVGRPFGECFEANVHANAGEQKESDKQIGKQTIVTMLLHFAEETC